MTSCPVTPPSATTATCLPAAGSMMPMLWSPLLATSTQPDAARAVPCNAIAQNTNERLRNAVSRCFIGAVSYHQDFRRWCIPMKDTRIPGFQGFRGLRNPENPQIQVFVLDGPRSAVGRDQNGLAVGEVEGLGERDAVLGVLDRERVMARWQSISSLEAGAEHLAVGRDLDGYARSDEHPPGGTFRRGWLRRG